MKKITNFITLFVLILLVSLFSTGCGTDEMDGINIIVTNYANEYIVERLYKDHSTISSVYPDGVDTSTYKVSAKQKKDFANADIFVYNGLLEFERNLAIDLLDINPKLKIIDTAYVLETSYAPEELWLNPASFLMMSQNVKNGLEEYITSTYLQKEIDDKYEQLKIDLSELDVEYREAISDTNNKDIVVDTSTLKYLEKFDLNVYCIDNEATDKTISIVDDLMAKKEVSYIITFNDTELGKNAKNLVAKYPDVKTLNIHKLSNIKDSERNNKEDYLSIMKNNLSLLNNELYQ